jgi:DNA-binding NarL/FixJ family response regulator
MPVLIFEKSEEITKRLIEMIIETQNQIQLFSAASYTDAVLLLQNINADNVLINLHFPGHLSFELLKLVKLKNRSTNVIMMYTYAGECELQQCISLGADHLVNLYDEFEKLPLMLKPDAGDNYLLN